MTDLYSLCTDYSWGRLRSPPLVSFVVFIKWLPIFHDSRKINSFILFLILFCNLPNDWDWQLRHPYIGKFPFSVFFRLAAHFVAGELHSARYQISVRGLVRTVLGLSAALCSKYWCRHKERESGRANSGSPSSQCYTVLIRALITQENGMPREKRGRDRGSSEQIECEEGGYGARFWMAMLKNRPSLPHSTSALMISIMAEQHSITLSGSMETVYCI